jgi:AcrR family transcriptional regulator
MTHDVRRRPRPTGSRRTSPRELAADTAKVRSERGHATYEQILSSAGAVFARMGYGGTRLEDIAAEAGISRTTVYHYFPSRRAVFVEIGRRATTAFRSVLDAARSIPDRWTEREVAGFVSAHLAYLDEHGAVLTTWTQATWDDRELRDLGLDAQLTQFRFIGSELQRLRGGTADVDPVHEGMAVLGMIERLWYFARVGGAEISDTDLASTLTIETAALLRRNLREH